MTTTLFAVGGVLRRWAWGSTTAIQQLLGDPVDGLPAAELWFGAHTGDPSPARGSTLAAVVAADPDAVLGPAAAARWQGELPFLLKLLAADTALSIQVHPSREQAQAGFAREQAAGIPVDAAHRTYRDANHKPELLCALTPFEGLCGFRRPEDVLATVERLAVPELGVVAVALRGPDGLRAAVEAVLDDPDPAGLATAVARACASGRADEPLAALVARLHADFPGDAGLVFALLLNHVVLAPGEAMFLGAGTVHAYLRGLGVEIMANSDNVLRCGLTPKHVDLAELMAVTDFTPMDDPRVDVVAEGPAGWRYPVPVPDFTLARVDVDGELALPPVDGPELLLCTSGRAVVERDAESIALGPGRAAFASPAATSLTIHGTGTLFRAGTSC